MLPTSHAPTPDMERLRWPTGSDNYRPDYHRSLTAVLPTLLTLLGRPVPGYPTLMSHLPPASPRRARRVFLLTLDALGFRELGMSPRLEALYEHYGTWITSVFPTITSCAMTSLYQALPPARHGILGHLIWKDIPGAIVDMLRMKVVGAESTLQAAGFDANGWKREPGILETPFSDGLPGYQLLDQHIVESGLSSVIYGRSARVGFVDPLEGFDKAARMLTDLSQGWVSLYLSQVDTLGHALTGDSPLMPLLLRHIEAGLSWLAEKLPPPVREETVLMVAADHGQSTIRERLPLYGDPLRWLSAHVRAVGNSGRVLHVYLDRRREAQVADWLAAWVGHRGRVYAYEEIRVLTGPEALFGAGEVNLPVRVDDDWVRRSLGDLVVVLDEGYNWEHHEPTRSPAPYASRLVSQHGAQSWNEMFVPFLCVLMSALSDA